MPSFARHPLGMLVVAALLLAGAPAVHIDAWSAATPAPKPAPTPWGACPINGREEAKDKLVRRFDRGAGLSTSGAVMPAGTSDLTCGDENHGYYHVANRHGSEWTQKGARSSENWRDVADYAIAEALRSPMTVTYRANNNTYCYSREVYLVDKVRGIPVDVFHPNVVVRAQDGIIITSYPANRSCR